MKSRNTTQECIVLYLPKNFYNRYWKEVVKIQHVKSLVLRLGLLMVVFSIIRLLFYFFNHSYFEKLDLPIFLGGLRFDLSAIVILNSLFIFLSLLPIPGRSSSFYQKVLRVVFFGINIPAIAMAMVDLEYYKFILKRSTTDLFNLLAEGDDLSNLLPVFFRDYWYLILLFGGFIWLLFKIYGKIEPPQKTLHHNARYITFQVVFFILGIGGSVVAARGGLQLRPLHVPDATLYTDAKHAPLVLNTPFTLLKSYGGQNLKHLDHFSDSDLDKWFSLYRRNRTSSYPKNEANVVIIILESFSKQYTGENDSLISYTPFLDSLLSQSLSFKHSYANGKKSMEAIPSILASLPAWMNEPFITSSYGSDQLTGLPALLKKKGYRSAFFHGGNDGTMGFEGFCYSIGTDRYLGRSSYPNSADFDGTWGIFDEPYMQFFAQQMDTMREPFITSVFTLSSHHPYKIPEQYASKFKGGGDEIAATIQYTDFSLRNFFEKAKQSNWFGNTLFVITADHTPASTHPYYNRTHGMWEVPIAFYFPEVINPKKDTVTVAQHIDIMPTVLDILGYEDPYLAFGESLFQKEASYMLNYIGENYWYLKKNLLLIHDGYKAVSLYNIEEDPMLLKNIVNNDQQRIDSLEMELFSKIQRYNNSLIKNQLLLP